VRILFSSTPGEGHVRPLLPLARALAERGHEVAFATTADWTPRLAAHGFPVLPAGVDHHRARAFLDVEEVRAVAAEDMRLFLFPRIFGSGHAPAKAPDLLARAREWGPDAIVHESADLAGPLVGAALGLATVNHSFGVMVPPAVSEAAAERVAPLWRAYGLEPDPLAGAFRGLYLDLAPPALRRTAPLGPWSALRPAEVEAVPGPPVEVETPYVYATMGTVWNEVQLFRVLLDALTGIAAVITTGRSVSIPGRAPAGIVVAEFLPQEEVLPHARAVVSHGGSGTMLGALAHGLPLVLVPQGADQFDNAARCADAGVAIVVERERADAAAIRAALDRVLAEPSYTEAARRVAAEIAAMPSRDEVAAAVEAFVAG
jgi:UDP:flavonoid glycosyltransferase YjiC (YdhE family)